MREIKFRAWGKDFNDNVERMFYDVQNTYDMIGNVTPSDQWENFDTALKDENFKIMQFTGLKDKNGKEIFEGDIVKVKVDKNKEPFLVVWQQDKMRFGLRDINEIDLVDSWAFTPENEFRVIGNIYETPELLKKFQGEEE